MRRSLTITLLTPALLAAAVAGWPSRSEAEEADISSPSIKKADGPPPLILVYSGAHFPLLGGPSSFSRSFLDDQGPHFVHRTTTPDYAPGSVYKRRHVVHDSTYAVPRYQQILPPKSDTPGDQGPARTQDSARNK